MERLKYSASGLSISDQLAMAQMAEVLRESAQLVQGHGHGLIFKSLAYFGTEREESSQSGEKNRFLLS